MCANPGNASNGNSSSVNVSTINPGEESYVRFPPTLLHPEGQPIVVTNGSGEYIYKGGFDKSDKAIDTGSAEYKRALRDYNIKAAFNADGSVSVTKGGLYSQKRTFKTIDAFQADANKRIDNLVAYHDRQAENTRRGVISQLQAENFKPIVRNNISSMAIKEMSKQLENDLLTARTNAAAGRDMKARLSNAIEKRKKAR